MKQMKKRCCEIFLHFIAQCYLLKALEVRIIDGPENTTVQEEESATFNCVINGTDAQPFWIIAGVPYTDIHLPPRHFYSSQYQLTVSNVSLSDNGTTYQCALFPQLLSDTVTLIVETIDLDFTLLAYTPSTASAADPTTIVSATATAAATTTTATVATVTTVTSNATTTATVATISTVTTGVYTTTAKNKVHNTELIAVATSTSALAVFVLSLVPLTFYCYWRRKKQGSLSIHPTHEEDKTLSSNNYDIIDLEQTNELPQDNSNSVQNEETPIYDVIPGDTPQNNTHEIQNMDNENTTAMENSNESTYCDQENNTDAAPREKMDRVRMYDTVVNEHTNPNDWNQDDTYSTLQHGFNTHSTEHDVNAHVKSQAQHTGITSSSTATKPDEAQYSTLNHGIIVPCQAADQYDVIPCKTVSESTASAMYSSLGVTHSNHATQQGGASIVKLDDIGQDGGSVEPVYSVVNKDKNNTNCNIITTENLSVCGNSDCNDPAEKVIEGKLNINSDTEGLPSNKEPHVLNKEDDDDADVMDDQQPVPNRKPN